MADKKASGKSKKAKAAKKPAKKAKAKPKKAKAKSKKAPKRSAARSSRATGLDKSVEEFRATLERNVTVSRDRLQEVVDDSVKRGRMTRGDAEKMLSDLIKRGRRQTDSLLKELERLVKQARKEVDGRSAAGPQTGDAGGATSRQETRLVSWSSCSWRGELELEIDSLASAGGVSPVRMASSSSSPARCPGTGCEPR